MRLFPPTTRSPETESACQRAKRDTDRVRHSLCGKAVAFVIALAGAIGAEELLASASRASIRIAVVVFLGAVAVGAVFGLVYLGQLVMAIWRQRQDWRERLISATQQHTLGPFRIEPQMGILNDPGRLPEEASRSFVCHLLLNNLEVTTAEQCHGQVMRLVGVNSDGSLTHVDGVDADTVHNPRCLKWQEGRDSSYRLEHGIPRHLDVCLGIEGRAGFVFAYDQWSPHPRERGITLSEGHYAAHIRIRGTYRGEERYTDAFVEIRCDGWNRIHLEPRAPF